MDPRLISQLAELRKYLTKNLTVFKGTFGLKSKEVWDGTLANVSPGFAKLKETVRLWKRRTSPVDWNDLHGWIDSAVGDFRRQYEQTIRAYEALGLTASDTYTSVEGGIEEVKQKITLSPQGKALRRGLGPNWIACLGMNGFQNVDDPEALVGADTIVGDAISKRTAKIVAHWETLKAAKASGAMASFGTMWSRLTTSQRQECLRQDFPQVHEIAQAEIYAWIQSTGSERSRISPSLFMTPLLNVEDLCVAEALPDLLNLRAIWHPAMFRAVDGRSVRFGQYGESLKLALPGQMTFASGRRYHDLASYEIDYARDCDPIQECSAYTTSASTGVLQLEAQCRTYEFLSACLDRLLEAPNDLDTQPSSSSDQPLSLLTKASLLDICGDPQVVDLDYLTMLLASSKDRAIDDLEQLRSDPDSFIEHWHNTSQQGPGRIANFLRPVFQRVDIFESLANLLNAIKQRVPITIETAEGATTSAIPDIMYLHAALQASLDDTLCNLKALSWSPAGPDDSVFGKLFNQVRECDPTVWIMGFSSAMLVIDRELRSSTASEVPLAIIQALNDVSVLAICVKETWKQYNFDAGAASSIHEVNRLETWWKQLSRPWLSLAEGGCEAMSKAERRKLENHMRKQEERRSGRMHSFWGVIDGHMDSSTTDSAILEFIQQRAPVDSTTTNQPPSYGIQGSHNMEPTVTATKIRLSRHRKQRQSAAHPSSQRQIASFKKLSVLMPVRVKPTRDLDFWHAFTAPSSENSTGIREKDFLSAMMGIGYRCIPQTGSQYRFEYVQSGKQDGQSLGTIVFHAPHGGGKLTHTQAQSWWLKRLSRRVQLDL